MRVLTLKLKEESARLEEDGGNGHWRRSPDDELQKNPDSRRCSGSQLAWLGEEKERSEAKLPAQAICSGRRGTSAVGGGHGAVVWSRVRENENESEESGGGRNICARREEHWASSYPPGARTREVVGESKLGGRALGRYSRRGRRPRWIRKEAPSFSFSL